MGVPAIAGVNCSLVSHWLGCHSSAGPLQLIKVLSLIHLDTQVQKQGHAANSIDMVQAYSQEDGKIMQESFADSVIYLGGMFPPNRIARQPLTLIHGYSHLDGCREVSPGIYTGGEWA